VVIDDLVGGSSDGERLGLALVTWALVEVNNLEVIVFGFIVVGQVPVDADVLEGHVVPLVVVGVVGDLVVMHILTLSPHTSQLNELAGVGLVGTASAILKFSRNPSAVDNNGRTVYSNWVLLGESTAE
jgi:hypothetical protein